MTESRQQRRARERKEAKLARRPASPPPGTPDPEPRNRIIDIQLSRIVLDDDPDDIYVAWAAEWGIRDDREGTEDNSQDLTQLVEWIRADLRPMAERYELKLEWFVGGDAPEGKTVWDEIARLGVQLPSTVA
ncbi:MAG: hypothetical protein ACRER3_00335 [Pseudomonas fluorescens]